MSRSGDGDARESHDWAMCLRWGGKMWSLRKVAGIEDSADIVVENSSGRPRYRSVHDDRGGKWRIWTLLLSDDKDDDLMVAAELDESVETAKISGKRTSGEIKPGLSFPNPFNAKQDACESPSRCFPSHIAQSFWKYCRLVAF